MRIFEIMIFWLVLKLEILVIQLQYLEGFWFLSEDFFFFGRLYYFCMLKYLSFHNSSFAFLRYNCNVKWQGHTM
jgi:hypothetical protein